MKFQLSASLLVIFLLSACIAPLATDAPVTSTAGQPTVSPMVTHALLEQIAPTSTPKPTRTLNPTNTPRPVSTAIPTFNAASVITRTPAPSEQCPKLSDAPLPDIAQDPKDYSFTFSPREQEVLDYLNAGGNPSNLIALLRKTWPHPTTFTQNEIIQDLTGDGAPEILIIPSELFIFGCQDGQYQTLMSRFSEAVIFNPIAQQLAGIQDMNLNGIPEVVVAEFGCGGWGAAQCLNVLVYEWDGLEFKSLLPDRAGYDGVVSMIGGGLTKSLPDIDIKDTDGNGTLELILIGGIINSAYSDYFIHYPWRDKIDTYMWDGQYFVLHKTEFSAPIYRYQAVQDGDSAMQNGEYEKALGFYQSAIFNDQLLGWSRAYKEYYISLNNYKWDPAYQATPTPSAPLDDPQEYPFLASYARYRIMLTHIILGNMTEATIVYDTLQQKFPEGSPGHEFALVAKAFWDEYQTSSNAVLACKKTIPYAKPEILIYLGSEHHNAWQDRTYHSEDICPFK